MAKSSRFEVVLKEDSMSATTRVLRDTQTGVCYLYHGVGFAGGLTPLLDIDGRPLVTPGGHHGSWEPS